MKKVFSILVFLISSQIVLAHPGSAHHAHSSFVAEWAWLLVPVVGLIAVIWKFSNQRQSSKVEK